MTEKQIWARKRNWLIRRLLGAKSIFSYSNILFMKEATKESVGYICKCEETINGLIKDMRESTYKEVTQCHMTTHKN